MSYYNSIVLKFELLSQGLVITEQARKYFQRDLKDGFAIGAVGKHAFDIILNPGKVYVGVPIGSAVETHLTTQTPFALEIIDGAPVITKKPAKLDASYKWRLVDPQAKGDVVAHVTLPPKPDYYGMTTESGLPMMNVMPMASDFTGGTISPYCHYWGHYESEYVGLSCRYCGIGVNIEKGRDLPDKSIDDFLETIAEARKFSYFRHGPVFAGGAYPAPDRGHLIHAKYVAAIKKEYPDNWMRLTIAPPDETEYIDALFESGVDLVGYNYEVYDRNTFARLCPGKVKDIEKGVPGHSHYDKMLSHIVDNYGKNRAHSNLILGLEEIDQTVAGMEHLASMGVIPTIFIFVPLSGTATAKHSTPNPLEMIYIYQKLREIVEKKYHLDTGCAGCHRMMVNTKIYDGLTPDQPPLSEEDLEMAGLPGWALHRPPNDKNK